MLDKLTSTLHDLRATSYSFVTSAGNFENRFELRFTSNGFNNDTTSAIDDLEITNTSGHQFHVVSPSRPFTSVEAFDILGKLLFSQKGLNTNIFQSNSLKANAQIILVKVSFDDQNSITRKIGIR